MEIDALPAVAKLREDTIAETQAALEAVTDKLLRQLEAAASEWTVRFPRRLAATIAAPALTDHNGIDAAIIDAVEDGPAVVLSAKELESLDEALVKLHGSILNSVCAALDATIADFAAARSHLLAEKEKENAERETEKETGETFSLSFAEPLLPEPLSLNSPFATGRVPVPALVPDENEVETIADSTHVTNKALVSDLNRLLAHPPVPPRVHIPDSEQKNNSDQNSPGVASSPTTDTVEVAAHEETPPPPVTGMSPVFATVEVPPTITSKPHVEEKKKNGGLMSMLSHMTKSRPKAGRSLSSKGITTSTVSDSVPQTAVSAPELSAVEKNETEAHVEDSEQITEQPLDVLPESPSADVIPRPPVPAPRPHPVPSSSTNKISRSPYASIHESNRSSEINPEAASGAPPPPPRPRPAPHPESEVSQSAVHRISDASARPVSDSFAQQHIDSTNGNNRPISEINASSISAIAESVGNEDNALKMPVIPPKPSARKIPGIFANQRGHDAMAAMAAAMSNRLSSSTKEVTLEASDVDSPAAVSSPTTGNESTGENTPSTSPPQHATVAATSKAAPPVVASGFFTQPLAIKKKENSHSGDDKAIERDAIEWLNKHLAAHDVVITDLYSSLGDGLNLIYALEDATGESVGRYNKRAVLAVHKSDNVAVALNFVAKRGISTAFLTPQDIIDGRKDKILTLFNYVTKKFE
ncbi:hypothetical protein HK100_009846 [Physocladia obscura]|uniref:Calponin-homology (CH) domain-containing protein n=1 Tax=Physocladia obscura TaxID=109957 RepID=A0AAD5TEZ5_9FUNG|nr:hypothetical protein HK100_009846 [Physocladia obscura]